MNDLLCRKSPRSRISRPRRKFPVTSVIDKPSLCTNNATVFRKLVAIGAIVSCLALFASEVLDDFDSAVFQPFSSKSATARLGDLTLAVDMPDEGGTTAESLAVCPAIFYSGIPDTRLGPFGSRASELRSQSFKTYILKRSLLI